MENNMCYGVDMSKEEWRDVKEFEGLYKVSNYGRVKGKLKILKVRNDGSIGLARNRIIYNRFVKRLVAEAFMPDFNSNNPVMYLDGDPHNNRLDNIVNRVVIGNSQKPPLNNSIIRTDKIIYDTFIIEGGFNEGQRIIFDITLAQQSGIHIYNLVNDNIIPNLKNMIEGVDYIDLMNYGNANNYLSLLLNLGYTEHGLTSRKHIYIFSERGVAKVMSTLQNSNPAKWTYLNNFVNEYFEMRKELKEQSNSIEQQKKDLLFAIYTGGQAGIIASKQLTELEVQEATKPLLDTIEKQAPKVDKFDKYMESDGTYNATNTAKLLNISSAQKFNNLLKEMKIQYKTGKNWVLYSKYQWLIDEGYCKYIEGENSNYSYMQLRWYPKGVDWLRTQIQ